MPARTPSGTTLLSQPGCVDAKRSFSSAWLVVGPSHRATSSPISTFHHFLFIIIASYLSLPYASFFRAGCRHALCNPPHPADNPGKLAARRPAGGDRWGSSPTMAAIDDFLSARDFLLRHRTDSAT